MTKQKKFEEFFGNLWRDGGEYENSVIDYAIMEDLNGMDYDEFYNYLNEKGFFDIKVIYYDRACQYLLENDSSLLDSLDLAIEYGYTMENLSSETLASLLASQRSREYFSENEEKIQNFLDTFNDIKEEGKSNE